MLAIIPARGGSKGVKNKNIKLLQNKPLIAHTIIEAINSKKIDRIIVSTDSEKIAEISIKYGAEVPFLRPSNISLDNSPILENYKFALKYLEENGSDYKSFVALQPTSPFRKSKDIDAAINLFLNNNVDSVISFVKENHPIEWNRLVRKDKTFLEFMDSPIHNRQIYNDIFRFNGAVYVFKKNLIMNNKMYSENSMAYIMPESRSLDIDTEDDFLFAEFLMEKNQKFNSKIFRDGK